MPQLRAAFQAVVNGTHVTNLVGTVKTAQLTTYHWAAASFALADEQPQDQPIIFDEPPGGHWQYVAGSGSPQDHCVVPFEVLQQLGLADTSRLAFDDLCQQDGNDDPIGTVGGGNSGLHFQTMDGKITCELDNIDGSFITCWDVDRLGGLALYANGHTSTDDSRDVQPDGITYQADTTHVIPLGSTVFTCAIAVDSVRCTSAHGGSHGIEVSTSGNRSF